MKKAEVSEIPLRNSDEENIKKICKRIFSLINPKFTEEYEENIAMFELKEFVTKCELTPSELMIAIDMCLKGRLYTEPNAEGYSERIKLFREIDRIKLGEIESAYLYLKTIDKNYEADTKQVKAFLEDKLSKETTEIREQKAKQNRQNLYQLLLKETQAGKICRHGFMFYEEFSQNEDFPDKQKTATEKWEQVYDKIKQRTAYEKSNRISVFSAQDLKMIESITKQGFDAFFIQRNIPTLTKIKALVKTEIQNESVFNYLKQKQENETNHRPEKSPHGGLQEQET